MNLFYPPNEVKYNPENVPVFLAGSIEMGTAYDWQADFVSRLTDLPVDVMNPRRPAWDSTWVQDPAFEPFRTQVEWELTGIRRSEIVAVNFVPGTMSPITLLELGLLLGRGTTKVFVCCPKDYHRYGNVMITCQLNKVTVVDNFDDLVQLTIKEIKKLFPSRY